MLLCVLQLPLYSLLLKKAGLSVCILRDSIEINRFRYNLLILIQCLKKNVVKIPFGMNSRESFLFILVLLFSR